MEIQFAIVRSENREYLCYKAGEAYVDACQQPYDCFYRR